LGKTTDLLAGCVWPFMCFYVGRESASIRLSNSNPQEKF
jgi:hypothetical protein